MRSVQVAEAIEQLPPGCLDVLTEGATEDGTLLPNLAWFQLDAPADVDWSQIEEADLDASVASFFEVVDGPLRQWAAERSTPERLLAVQTRAGGPESCVADLVRTMAVLAVQQGLVDVARELVAGYVPTGQVDTEDRFARFEVELARRLPAYGSPARS